MKIKLRNLFAFVFLFISMVGLASVVALADDIDKKPLHELFNEIVIVPYDYQNKAFISGQLNDVYGEYEIFQKEGRVLVPIRLMGYLVDQLDVGSSYWETIWLPERPDEVVLRNHNFNQSIIFTVDSQTMMVNGEPQTLDVPPQNIGGRIVLPLRSAAEALGKTIDWLDGLILIGDANVDLQHPKTLQMKDRIKTLLTDPRQPVAVEEWLYPVAKYNDALYFTNREFEQLYNKLEGQQAKVVPLVGNPKLAYRQVIDDVLYYVTAENNEHALYAHHFHDGTSIKIANLENWSPRDGWLAGVYSFDDELYVNLHRGDITMGLDTLYKVKQDQLINVATAKSFISLEKAGEFIYYTDFTPMVSIADNFKQVHVETGETTNIGEPGYTYGVSRTYNEQNGTRYASNDSLYYADGKLYVLGFNESDREDKSAVYKWDLATQTQTKLTSPTEQFWMLNEYIYFIDSDTGHFKRVDTDGNHMQVLSKLNVVEAELYDGQFYFTANAGNGQNELALYVYHTANEQAIKLGEQAVRSFYVGQSGVYYVSDGYEIGLYKVDRERGDENVLLVQDRIDTVQMTTEGIIYTLKYEPGIFTAK